MSEPIITIYWRPACGFCSRLRSALADAPFEFTEVNIWDDPRGAETVRRFARGNETVPTVVIGDPDDDDAVGLVNPPASDVLRLVASLRDG